MRPSLLRWLAVIHVVLLVTIRIVTDRDDVNNWDLIPFLNAQVEAWPSLLQRSEVHFRNPFSVPLYIIGGESVLGAVLFPLFGRVSLYWANPLFAFCCAALFLFLVDRLFASVLAGSGSDDASHDRARTWAWLALSMSPVFLTFTSTSPFNVQGYAVIVLGLLGVEEFARGRDGRGTVFLALAFLFIAQGYALSLFLPYYVLAWALLRAFFLRRPRVLRCLLPMALLAVVAHVGSGGAYLRKIAPWNPHDTGNVLAGGGSALAGRIFYFWQQSFWPSPSPGAYTVAFGPVFLWVALAWFALRARPWGRTRRELGMAFAGLLLLGFAYAPSFLSPVVKSHRSLPADLLLVTLAAMALVALVGDPSGKGRLRRGEVLAVLAAGALLSDARYLRAVLRVDHTENHFPVFDLDPADSLVRHDLQHAIEAMRYQSEALGAALLIVYPRVPRSESTTDPALFHARFLRHFGPYAERTDLAFACHFCEPRYGCPFPDVRGQPCAETCCPRSPVPEWRRWRDEGRPVFLWSWAPAQEDVWTVSRESVLPRAEAEALPVLLPEEMSDWECEELVPPGVARQEGGKPHEGR